MLPGQFTFISVALNLIGVTLYIKSIIKGETKPNLVSWFMWMLAPFIGVFFQLKAGAGWSVFPIFMAGFDPLLVLVVALFVRNAFWKINSFDLACGLFSLVSLILYIITHYLAISIVFAILSDALAFIPSFIKGWRSPETESSAAYSWCIASNIIGLLVIKEWSFTIYSFGVYLIIFNVAMTLVLKRKKITSFFSQTSPQS